MRVTVSVQLESDEEIVDADKSAAAILQALGGNEEDSFVQVNVQPAAQTGTVGVNPMSPPIMPPTM
jgi:hypothetical protein